MIACILMKGVGVLILQKKNSASLQAYPSFRRLRIMCLPVLPYEDYMCL